MATRYDKMTDEELKEEAKRRRKKDGSYTKTAISAQQELWKRTHWTSNRASYDNGYIDRGIEDIQYNG